jgi:methyltransferase
MMTFAIMLLTFVTLQRASELVIARRNTRALIAQGAVETGAAHYPAMVLLHASWLTGLWWFGWDAALNPWFTATYAALQVFRVWILATLGKRWTTRILTMPGETLVTRGPFKLFRHPNYVLVALEVPLLPLAFGLTWFAALFGALNLIMLWWRIRAENQALGYSQKRQFPQRRKFDRQIIGINADG